VTLGMSDATGSLRRLRYSSRCIQEGFWNLVREISSIYLSCAASLYAGHLIFLGCSEVHSSHFWTLFVH
jgi:hypothetical protein